MKKNYLLLLCTFALFGAVSCSDNSDDTIETPDVEQSSASKLYTLNSGSFGSNNASLSSYNTEDGVVVEDLFLSQNGQGLGDTAQDIIMFEDKLFITVYGSGLIFVTELDGTIITQIVDDYYEDPRYLAADDDYVYVSYYDGGVGKIDPTTYEVTTASITTEGNPEQVALVDSNLYVAVSDYGYGNAESVVAVFDTTSMTLSKNIAVIQNPTALAANSTGDVFVISMGNYGYGDPAIYATLQKIDATTEAVTELSISGVEGNLPSTMVMGVDDVLYVVEGISDYSTDWQMVGSVYAYNTTTGSATEFISDGTSVPAIYSISTNLTNGEVYVGSSDYYNTGDVYLFNADGTLKTSFEVGLNPIKVIEVDVEE
ncbi:MAG: DUF5074 domain-containing protein [Rikenellaceae bacterium]